ncbi:MAG: hypothetical protein CL683_12330 [Brevundimonas sp.]|nr:hypothetical protein [Brevundimonas sp.]MAL89666.1 hypothetical protein [Brevundimonas sp.]
MEPGHKFRAPEPSHRRTLSKVRRNSRPAGGEKWERLTREQANRRIFALKVYRQNLRQPGQRWGAPGTISAGAVELYELLCNMAVKGHGRIEPSVNWLAKARNVPLKVIHRWKAQLREHGFLDWRRRWVGTGRDGLRGPQVVQTSNAYWINLPRKALEMIEALARRKNPDWPRPEPSPELAAALSGLGNAIADHSAARDRFRLE